MGDEEIDENFLDLLDEGMSNATPLSSSLCVQIARIQKMAEESREREALIVKNLYSGTQGDHFVEWTEERIY